MSSGSSIIFKNRLYSTITMVFLLISPILNMYSIFGGYYLDIFVQLIIIAVFFIILFISKDSLFPELKMPQKLLLFFIYYFIISFFSNVKVGFHAMISLPVILAFFIYLSFWGTFTIEQFLKIYKFLAVIFISFFFVQILVQETTGIGLSGVIPGIPLSEGVSENFSVKFFYSNTRSPSFFSEPSHFAQFLLPLLILVFFDNFYCEFKFKWVWIIVIISVLLLLRSGTALLGLIPTSIFFFINYWKTHPNNKPTFIFFLAVLLTVICIIVKAFVESDFGSFIIERSEELNTIAINDSSGFIRIWRGYYVFGDFSLFEKIFGNPCLEDILVHVKNSHMEMNFEGFSLTYFNGIQTILIRTGFVGLGLFFSFLVYLWRNNTICGHCLLFACTLLMFVESTFLTPSMAVYLLLAQSQKKEISIKS